MIFYHPAYDVHHCIYRLLNILSHLTHGQIDKDTIRLIDFYYVYPHLLKNVTLPRAFSKYKKTINEYTEPFEITPNPKSLFFDLSRVQDSALSSLLQRSLINIDGNSIKLREAYLPNSVIDAFKNDTFVDTTFFKCLIESFPKLRINGKDGFKERCGLMEYRYD